MRAILLFIPILISLLTNAQSGKKYTHDFGKVKEWNNPVYEVIYTNNAAKNLYFLPIPYSQDLSIKFGKENATEEEIIEAAKNAVVHDNIIEFTNGYKTILGERGVTLSGGQKQRVSIARAIIKNPKILIFDDCLSAVDTETEEKILSNLEKVSKNKTTFIISHRVSSAKNADKIIILDAGKIAQQGTHNQLITEQGYYKDLYEQQLLEKEI